MSTPTVHSATLALLLALVSFTARAEGGSFNEVCEAMHTRVGFQFVSFEPMARPPSEKPNNKELAACFRRDPASPWNILVNLSTAKSPTTSLTIERPEGIGPLVITAPPAPAGTPLTVILAGLMASTLARDDVFIDNSARDRAACETMKAAKATVSLMITKHYVPEDAGQSVGSDGAYALSEAIRAQCLDAQDIMPGAPLDELAQRRGPFLVRGDVTTTRLAASGDPLGGSMSRFTVDVTVELVTIPGTTSLLSQKKQLRLMGTNPDVVVKSDAFKKVLKDLARDVGLAVLAEMEARKAAPPPPPPAAPTKQKTGAKDANKAPTKH
jgi:hypothetical protein